MIPKLIYRYPTEYRNLTLTIIASVLILALTATISFGTLLLLLLGLLLLNYLVIRTQIEGYKRSAVAVTQEQYPEIHRVVLKCRQYIPIPDDTNVYIIFNPKLNAYAMGMGRPYAIVLHSALVEALDEGELTTVIGHEMGHIAFGHTTLLTFIGVLGNQTLGIPLLGDVIRFIFLFWSRSTEFTSDRAGLVAGGRLDKAISTELILSVGPELARKINLTALEKQGEATRTNLLSHLGEMQSTHPMLTSRLQQLRLFALSDVFHSLRPDAILTEPGDIDGITCPKCGRVEIDRTASFCNDCGASLNSPQLTCSQCNTPLQTDWKVCPKCGKPR
jgi:Zn-dependent protease with chaperone function